MKGESPRQGRVLAVAAIIITVFSWRSAAGQGAGVQVPEGPPLGMQAFNLTLAQMRASARTLNFEVVGHSYFKVPERTSYARLTGLGSGFNTPRVHRGIGYFGGYNSPPTLFGILIADVRDPANMRPLSFIPCNPGTRCPYIRLNTDRMILVGTHDRSADNPDQPPPGQPVRAGVGFYDVSSPSDPRMLSFVATRDNGNTHGLEIDDRYVYACANTPQSKTGVTGNNQELVIIDYADPRNARVVSTLHIPGQHVGETFESADQANPDGTPQKIWCHEINLHRGRLYIAWRDAGLVIVDVQDPTRPRIISRLDYVPPYNGGSLGAAHTAAPVVVDPERHARLVALTDEIFDCPPGFGRLVDVSDVARPVILSTYRLPHVSDIYDPATGKFICPSGQQSIHQPWFDYRSSGLMYQAWYDQGLRAWDISNPYLPREIGYYLSPRFAVPGRPADRHTREVYQDPETGLIYMTDGNGGGITVLRWTGPIPRPPVMPGVR
jgi:hypothetical protein